jgi:hypothetical protein
MMGLGTFDFTFQPLLITEEMHSRLLRQQHDNGLMTDARDSQTLTTVTQF